MSRTLFLRKAWCALALVIPILAPAQQRDDRPLENCKGVSEKFWSQWRPSAEFVDRNCRCAVASERFPSDPEEVQNDLRPILALVKCARPDFLELTTRAGQFDSLERSLEKEGYSSREIAKVRSCHAARMHAALTKSIASNTDFSYGVSDFIFCEGRR